MIRPEAEALLDLLIDAYDKVLSEKFRAFYIKRLMECEQRMAQHAADHAINTEKNFPRWATFKSYYAPLSNQQRERLCRDERAEPLVRSPAELRKAAATLAEYAAERAAERGAPDAFATYAGQQAERFSENARRLENGELMLPLPSMRDLLRMAFGTNTPRRRMLDERDRNE